jgi:ribosome-associated toxin RatA of RatAB toxin-antitoxin module
MRGYVVALLILAGSSLADNSDWQRIADRDGIIVERRSVGGSSMRELRTAAHSPLPPAAIMATIWKQDEYVQFMPYLKRLDVLRDDGDTKVIYEQLRIPLAKDRDLTVRVTRTSLPDTGAYEIASLAVADEGPPETDDYVRVRTSVAGWRLTPAADGGTDVSYTIRTDAGGLMPVWILDAAQKNVTVKILRAMLDRAQQQNDAAAIR